MKYGTAVMKWQWPLVSLSKEPDERAERGGERAERVGDGRAIGWDYERLSLWSTKVCRGDEWPARSQFG